MQQRGGKPLCVHTSLVQRTVFGGRSTHMNVPICSTKDLYTMDLGG